MPTTSAFSARNSRIAINGQGLALNPPSISSGTFLYARKWTIGIRVDDLDVATFEDYGFANHEDGLMDADISFDGFWDARVDGAGLNGSLNAATAPPVLYPGALLSNSFYFIKGSGDNSALNNQLGVGAINYGAAYYFPLHKLFSCTVDAGVRDTLNISYTARNQGVFYCPGQSASNANPRNTWH